MLWSASWTMAILCSLDGAIYNTDLFLEVTLAQWVVDWGRKYTAHESLANHNTIFGVEYSMSHPKHTEEQ